MAKRKTKKKEELSDKARKELLEYIIKNINSNKIPKREKILALRFVAADLGVDAISNCRDGCRSMINNLSRDTIENIIDLIELHIGNKLD